MSVALSQYAFVMCGASQGLWKVVPSTKVVLDSMYSPSQELVNAARKNEKLIEVVDFELKYKLSVYTGKPYELPEGYSLIDQFIVGGKTFNTNFEWCLVEIWSGNNNWWAIVYDVNVPIQPQILITITEQLIEYPDPVMEFWACALNDDV